MLIEVRNLSKWFGDVIALNSLSLNIGQGITGVVGPNGAGKSTLFKLMMGLLRPNKGYILVRGQNPWANHPLMQHMGYLPDHEFLPENISGYDYLKFTGGLRGLESLQLEERIQDTAHLVDMVSFLDRKIQGYSKGMKQRIKIAGTLIHEPSLIILDEPLAGTDPTVRKNVFHIIEKLHQEGKNIIISSHVLQDIERVTNNVVLLYRGRSIAYGTISEMRTLLDQYPHNIVISCDERRRLAKDLLEYEWVKSVDVVNHQLTVKVSELEEFYEIFSKLVIEKDYDIKEVYSKDEDLESIFKYLMRG
ncbi:MAG: ABC transporter ATP-binding protein [Thermoplasmata archaeon]